ncbi:MAG: cation transporter, partial [Planctomycetota bacterium]
MTSEKKHDAGERQIKSVTYLGIMVNIVLAIIKIAVGLLATSLSLVADGVHSLSDLATDAVLLLGVRL